MAESAGGIRAGRAYVELMLKSDLQTKLKEAEKQCQRFGAAVQAVGRAVAEAGLGMLAGFGFALKQFGELGTEMAQMSQRTGVSVESLSTLGYAAEQSGASLEGVEHGLRHMAKAIAEAAGGSKEARQHLAALGLSARQLQGLAPDDAFRKLGQALADVPDPARRTALAMEILGREGGQLLPMFGPGSEAARKLGEALGKAGAGAGPAARDLAALEKEARDLGIVMTGTDAAAALDFGNSLKGLWATVKMGVFQVGSALAPELKALVGWLRDGASWVLHFVQQNKALIQTAALVAAGIAAAGAALVVVGAVVAGVGAVIGGIVAVVTGIGTAIGVAWGVVAAVFGALISPVGLVIVGIAAAAAALLYFTGAWGPLVGAGQSALGQLGEAFQNVKATALAAWGGIRDALAAGDLALAARIAWTAVKLAVLENTQGIQHAWIEVMGFLNDVWIVARTGAQAAWVVIRESALAAVDALLDGFEALKPVLKSVWDFFLQASRIAMAAAMAEAERLIGILEHLPGAGRLARGLRQGLEAAGAANEAGLGAADEALGGALRQGGPRERLTGRGATVADVGRAGLQELSEAGEQRRDAHARVGDLAGLKKELADAIAQAAKEREAASKPALPPLPRPEQLAPPSVQGTTAGSFTASVVAQLGSDKAAAQTAVNTKATADGVKQMNAKLDRLQPGFV